MYWKLENPKKWIFFSLQGNQETVSYQCDSFNKRLHWVLSILCDKMYIVYIWYIIHFDITLFIQSSLFWWNILYAVFQLVFCATVRNTSYFFSGQFRIFSIHWNCVTTTIKRVNYNFDVSIHKPESKSKSKYPPPKYTILWISNRDFENMNFPINGNRFWIRR